MATAAGSRGPLPGSGRDFEVGVDCAHVPLPGRPATA